MNKNISYNRTAIVNQNGTVSSMTISRAFSIGMIVDNLDTTFLGEADLVEADNTVAEMTKEKWLLLMKALLYSMA